MTTTEFLAVLKECPLIASVQASPGSPLDDPETLLKLAKASLMQGVKVLRLEGVENIKRIKGETGVPVIGLIKRKYPDSEIYITPTMREVEELLETGCEVIAMDCTGRSQPGGETLEPMLAKVRAAGRIALADCDSQAMFLRAKLCGFDIVSSTLAGYTDQDCGSPRPDLLLVREHRSGLPLLAEGRFDQESQVKAALATGAIGVVIGSAINDAYKQTAKFVSATRRPQSAVGAVDIGGTWMRFATFGPDWKPGPIVRIPLPDSNEVRKSWILEQCQNAGVAKVGIATGGTIDPRTGKMHETKDTIPDNVGYSFREGLRAFPLNDGLAAAWGHACAPIGIGEKTFTISLGTGVGAGYVVREELLTAWNGRYPRVNDLFLPGGLTVEESLGGKIAARLHSDDEKLGYYRVFESVLALVHDLFMPDGIVVCGGVAASDWFQKLAEDEELHEHACSLSPFGEDAGLYGAAALALWPPIGVFSR
ncbi:MAG: putative N-acetylmannosamine-6-phosphate 2-epimerase [Armatimonadetes bacterium]|nr:putative N-acetylmannosamine-6-phosphate 2-epimerase [Armatimonadota bacterium]